MIKYFYAFDILCSSYKRCASLFSAGGGGEGGRRGGLESCIVYITAVILEQNPTVLGAAQVPLEDGTGSRMAYKQTGIYKRPIRYEMKCCCCYR